MDAQSIGEHVLFLEKCAAVDDEEDRDAALRQFGKWLKAENLGTLKQSVFVLNEDAAYGKHFASRYTRFHQLAETIAWADGGGLSSSFLRCLQSDNGFEKGGCR